MAAYNVQLKRSNGSIFEDVFVKTKWHLVGDKPLTFPPTSHNHIAQVYNLTTLTSASTPQKEVILSGYEYNDGDIFVLSFTYGNSATSSNVTVRIQVGSSTYLPAVPIYIGTAHAVSTNFRFGPGTSVVLRYNEEYQQLQVISINASMHSTTGYTNSVMGAGLSFTGQTKRAGAFYASTTNPTAANRLNYDGHLYATKVFAGGVELGGGGSTDWTFRGTFAHGSSGNEQITMVGYSEVYIIYSNNASPSFQSMSDVLYGPKQAFTVGTTLPGFANSFIAFYPSIDLLELFWDIVSGPGSKDYIHVYTR